MKKNFLLAGLLVLGLGLTGCANNDGEKPSTESTPAASETTPAAPETTPAAPETTPEGTETTPVEPAAPVALLTGSSKLEAFGDAPTTAEFKLLDAKNCIMDIEFPTLPASFAAKFDATGTYKIENGTITATVKQSAGDAGGDAVPEKETTLTLTPDAEGNFSANYQAVGSFTIDYAMTGKWVNDGALITGSSKLEAFGDAPTTAEFKMLDSKNCIVDIEFPTLPASFAAKFDATGTYKIENGTITATVKQSAGDAGGDAVPEKETTLTLTADAEGNFTANYQAVGSFTIDYAMTGTWAGTLA